MVGSDHTGAINISNLHEISMVNSASWIVKFVDSSLLSYPYRPARRFIDELVERHPRSTGATMVVEIKNALLTFARDRLVAPARGECSSAYVGRNCRNSHSP